MPELALDIAEVSTTRFTTVAAMPRPARANIAMNGLSPATYSVHGVTAIRMIERADVEEQDADRDRVDRLRQVALRILGLGGRGADQFDSDECEHRDLEAGDEAHEAVREHPAVVPEVREAGGAGIVLEPGEDHHETRDDERDDRDDLDQREPELHLAEGRHGRKVQREQDHDDGEAGDPQRDARDQRIRVPGDRDHIGDTGDDPAEPVRPPGEEPGPRPEQVAREVAEGLVLQVRQQQLAHRAHHEEQHESDDHVDEDHGWSGDRDGLAAAHEQAGADGPADRQQLDVTVAERAAQVLLVALRRVITRRGAVIARHGGPLGHCTC